MLAHLQKNGESPAEETDPPSLRLTLDKPVPPLLAVLTAYACSLSLRWRQTIAS